MLVFISDWKPTKTTNL